MGTNFDSNKSSDYIPYTAKAKKLSHIGRLSGGVIVLVHKKYEPFISEVHVDADNIIVVKIDKLLFGTAKDIMYISCYIPPYDSPFWQTSQHGYGMEVLDQVLLDLYDLHDDFSFILNGDFNARTASRNFSGISDDFDDMSINVNTQFPRVSQDDSSNMFGDQLLELCNMYECLILNGLHGSNFDGNCTYISDAGTSVVDYFIMSRDLFLFRNNNSLSIMNEIDSDHFPVKLGIEVKKTTKLHNTESRKFTKARFFEKQVWENEKEQEFVRLWKSHDIQKKLEEATISMDENIDISVSSFVETLKLAGKCMKKKCSTQKKINKNSWFDSECAQAKKETRQKLKHFRATRCEDDRREFMNAKKKYKYMVKHKRKTSRYEKITRLENNIKNSAIFWDELRSMGCGKQHHVVDDSIDINDWCDHFKGVFKTNDFTHSEEQTNDCDATEDSDHILNEAIKEVEVCNAIQKLKTGKSCGLDDISAEMLKAGSTDVIIYLTKLFNLLFDQGIYPKDWAKAIIVPIHKKGDTNQVNNYRGVSLLSVISKCFSSILNTRLYNWLETNGKISENQAGFRKNYSTIDQIFSLHSIVQKCMCKKGTKLYVAFVDFKKAFDSVRHDKMLECLKNNGVKGKFFASLRSMYDCLLSCVRSNAEYSEFFQCPIGVRQGCILSPTLFSLFINQLSDHLENNGRHGISLMPDILELFILLFADDVALLSTTPVGLQNQLNCLKVCCENMALNVNRDKTKVMVFRKGGYLGKYEKWSYEGTKLEVVNQYCYLGYNFTTKLSHETGTNHLVSKGKKAVVMLNRAFQKYKEMTSNTYFTIFDAKIKSILLYSSEIWGYEKLHSIEKVHLKACKRFMGIPEITPNVMVYGDLGRYPIYVNAYVNCVKYWIRLLNMEHNRIPKQAYLMLVGLDSKGNDCWATKIREILCETGFAFVWLQQGVGNPVHFLKTFKQRIIDMYLQEWSSTIRDKDRYESYRSFKVVFEREKYLSFIDTYCFRVAMTQTRLGVLPINKNLHRFSPNAAERCCPACDTKFEDEQHFFFKCPLYCDLRHTFLYEMPKDSWQSLLELKKESHCWRLAKYVFSAVNRRKRYLLSNITT